jgi:hypothetical protein
MSMDLLRRTVHLLRIIMTIDWRSVVVPRTMEILVVEWYWS